MAAQPSRSSTPASVPGQGQRSRTPQHVHGSLDVSGSPTSSPQSNHLGQTPHDAGQSNGPSILNPPLQTFQTQHGHGHHHHPHVHAHGHFANGQFPPQLQQAFAQFHAVNQQLAAQLAAIGNNPAPQGVQSNQSQGQPFQQPVYTFNQAQYPHIIPQHQHARAAGTQQGMRGSPLHTGSNDTLQPPSQAENAPPQDVTQAPTPPPGPTNTNTVVRENIGTNGERWQMIVQSGLVNMNPIALGSTRANQILSQPSNAVRDQLGHNVGLIQLHSRLSAIEAALNMGNPPPDSIFDQARETLNTIPEVQEDAHDLARRRIDNMADRANQLRRTSQDTFIREAHERAATHRGTQGAESSAVYVLSSPSGPQALLVSPMGLYTTPWQFPALGTITPYSSMNYAPNSATPPQLLAQNNVTNRQQPQADAAQVAHVHQQVPQQAGPAQIAPVHQQQQQQQPPNQARDLLRILLPLGGHLWLMIRLFGFVYFFTAGAGWRRTILLGLLAILVFIAQTGIFRPIILGIWDPIRRHAEGLVPLVGNERPQAGAVGNRDNANTAGTGPANREPTPNEALERLLQARERQNGNIVRQSIRRVERAIALFVASLIPGVGERHIAAREAARELMEEAGQIVALDREDRARREQEEAEQRQEADAPGQPAAEASSAAAGPNVESSAAGEQDQTAQPPLVEI